MEVLVTVGVGIALNDADVAVSDLSFGEVMVNQRCDGWHRQGYKQKQDRNSRGTQFHCINNIHRMRCLRHAGARGPTPLLRARRLPARLPREEAERDDQSDRSPSG